MLTVSVEEPKPGSRRVLTVSAEELKVTASALSVEEPKVTASAHCHRDCECGGAQGHGKSALSAHCERGGAQGHGESRGSL